MNLFLLEKQNYINKQNITRRFLLLFLFSIHRGLNTVLIIAHFIYTVYAAAKCPYGNHFGSAANWEQKTVPPLRGCVSHSGLLHIYCNLLCREWKVALTRQGSRHSHVITWIIVTTFWFLNCENKMKRIKGFSVREPYVTSTHVF